MELFPGVSYSVGVFELVETEVEREFVVGSIWLVECVGGAERRDSGSFD